MSGPVYGCDGCRGTAGSMGCPTHGQRTITVLSRAAAPPVEPPRCEHGAIREPCIPCSESVPPAPDRAGLREALTDLQGELSGTERRTYDDHSWANHVAIQVQKVMDAVTASPEPTGLDAAWAEAEAALPEGWVLWMEPGEPSGYHFMAERRHPMDEWDEGVDATADTPAAALRALAARLRESA